MEVLPQTLQLVGMSQNGKGVVGTAPKLSSVLWETGLPHSTICPFDPVCPASVGGQVEQLDLADRGNGGNGVVRCVNL